MKISEDKLKNQVKLTILSNSANIALARVTAAAFAAQADLVLSEIDEIKVAVSEAVSNSVIHGYKDTNSSENYIEITMNLYSDSLEYVVTDYGTGIEDVEAARQPSYSSDPERMGLGFAFMESFMDKLDVKSKPGLGTSITMSKSLKVHKEH